MARLTLSEQLLKAQAALAAQLSAMEQLQQEVYQLRNAAASYADRLVETTNVAVTRTKADLALQMIELEKKLKDKEISAGYQASRLQLVENEIEQAHAVLDGVEGAPERSYKKNDDYGGTVQRNVVTRLAGAFLAIARNSGKVQA